MKRHGSPTKPLLTGALLLTVACGCRSRRDECHGGHIWQRSA
jgi:hypothetical protein